MLIGPVNGLSSPTVCARRYSSLAACGFVHNAMSKRYNPHMITRLLLATIALATAASAQSKLQLKVHTGSGANGYDVNSTMISGEKDMLVIDPQFSLSEAHC